MTMRYQKVIQDSLALINGRRSTSSSSPTWKTGKEDEDREETNGVITAKTSSTFEGKGMSRFRSPSKTSQENHINGNGTIAAATEAEAEDPNSSPPTTSTSKNHHSLESNGVVKGGGGGNDTFLQWGHRKRSRCSRGMALTDETSSSTSILPSSKLQRRNSPQSLLPNSIANAMLPPSSQPSTNGVVSRGGPNLRTPTKNTSSSPSPVRRNLEERSHKSPPSNSGGGGSGSRGVSSRSRVGKKLPCLDKKSSNGNLGSVPARGDAKMNGGCSSSPLVQQQEAGGGTAAAAADMNRIVSPPHGGGGGGCSIINDDTNNHSVRSGKVAGVGTGGGGGGGGEKVNNIGIGGGNEVIEWPRIYIPLSRKEKEEDFLAMKGTKLPHRPKKRAKTVDRMLQYCFPGMWLSDLTRGRYEVREKKCPRKQKRRGLKGMETLESDSE